MEHPITPPPDLAAKWVSEIYGNPAIPLHPITLCLVERAAQWGADQELEACCQYISNEGEWFAVPGHRLAELRAARRPKPPSLKEQALLQLDTLKADLALHGRGCDLSQIRRALEQLND
jgi:hypothetical protein